MRPCATLIPNGSPRPAARRTLATSASAGAAGTCARYSRRSSAGTSCPRDGFSPGRVRFLALSAHLADSPRKEAVMVGTAFIDSSDSVVEAAAREALARWLHDHPDAGSELEEASRAHIHLQELEVRTTEAGRDAAETAQRAASLAAKLDPADHRILGFVPGALIVAALTVLDGVPLNWAAQAFGLNSAGTWLITGILLVASVGAMVG